MSQNPNHHASSIHMADVSGKPVTRRRALACGRIRVGREAFELIIAKKLPKGDPLTMAEIAGIQATKLTPSLIPLCHPIALNRAAVFTCPRVEDFSIEVYCLAEIDERTGVEMEALCGVSVALLTIWDLTKPINAALEISATRLLFKSGGKQGEWRHPDGLGETAEAILKAQ